MMKDEENCYNCEVAFEALYRFKTTNKLVGTADSKPSPQKAKTLELSVMKQEHATV